MSRRPRPLATAVLVLVFSATIVPAAAPTTQPVDLLKGATWKWTAEQPSTQPATSPAASRPATPSHWTGEAEFQVAYPPRYASLDLLHRMNPQYKMRFTLNGHEIRPPLEGMLYKAIPGIDASWLVEGRNVLTTRITSTPPARAGRSPQSSTKDAEFQPPKMKLLALQPTDLEIITGPVLGISEDRKLAVTCRTNMLARVTLSAEGTVPGRVRTAKKIKSTSPAGLFHHFTLEGISPRSLRYELEARTPDGGGSAKLGPWTTTAQSQAGRLRFVALGDNRSNPDKWAAVAAAALAAKPDLVVHTGDLVSQGRLDWYWADQFFNPAKELLATAPFYPVIGNHEGEAPLYYELFPFLSPQARPAYWRQAVDGVLLIGIDGEADWSAGGDNAKWLEESLAGSKARFIFLITHYPAWSSSQHGRLEANSDKPAERPVRQAREVIMPLLAKYHATAMIAGHDHNYQRSEPPEGVTVIVTGGAGAPLYKESAEASRQNPYSKTFADVLNYCVFTVDGGVCTMQALTPDGKVLDTRTWTQRP